MNDTMLRASTVGAKDFTADTKAPVISGVKNHAYYTDEVEVTLSDNVGIKSATVNTIKMGNEECFYNDATYTIRATDFAGNKSVKVFTIDTKAPTVKGVANNKYYNTAKVVTFSDKNGIKSAKLDGRTVKSGVKVYTSKKHQLVVTDMAGNVKSVKFTIK